MNYTSKMIPEDFTSGDILEVMGAAVTLPVARLLPIESIRRVASILNEAVVSENLPIDNTSIILMASALLYGPVYTERLRKVVQEERRAIDGQA